MSISDIGWDIKRQWNGENTPQTAENTDTMSFEQAGAFIQRLNNDGKIGLPQTNRGTPIIVTPIRTSSSYRHDSQNTGFIAVATPDRHHTFSG